MNLPYKSVEDVANVLKVRYFPGFRVLPYNRFDLKHSQHWWLSPASENPAFRYGKVMCTTNDAWTGEGRVFCGFNVEKGVLHEGDWAKTNVMDNTWFWHRFLKLANEPLVTAVSDAARAVDGNIQVFVAAGVLVTGAQWSHVLFDTDGGRLATVDYQPGDGLLAKVATNTSIPDFADALRTLDGPTTAWQWIDVLIGQSFTLDTDEPDDTDACAAMLKSFETWMRAA